MNIQHEKDLLSHYIREQLAAYRDHLDKRERFMNQDKSKIEETAESIKLMNDAECYFNLRSRIWANLLVDLGSKGYEIEINIKEKYNSND